MTSFKSRSTEKELIDEKGIPFTDWQRCLEELNTVNTLLGGHSITVEGVSVLLKGSDKPFTIAEIGCGGGDNLKAIHRNFKGQPLRITGIDIDPSCVEFAAQNCAGISQAAFICSDYRNVDFGHDKPDIIFNSLFCHHFSNDQLVEMLVWMRTNSRLGFFINDLQRHPVAFYSIKALTGIFSRSYLVKHDAPVSVARGFVRSEWRYLLQKADITRFCIKWRWAFRYLVIVPNG